MSDYVHDITIIEHGARANIYFARCSCGWTHDRPVRGWDRIERLTDRHRRDARDPEGVADV